MRRKLPTTTSKSNPTVESEEKTVERITELTNRFGVWGTLGLGVFLAALLAVISYIYVFAPYQEEIGKKQIATENAENNVVKLKVLSEDREMIIDRGAAIYASYLKGSRLLPSGEQISQVIEAIEGKAGQVGTQVISFDAFKLGIKPQGSEVSERIVEGEIRGNHESLVGFLRSISYNERITEVRSISAVKDNKGSERLKFVLAAYYMPTQIQVPEEMRERALKILEKEKFDLEPPTVTVPAATAPQNN